MLAEIEDVARKDQIFLMENSGVSAMASPFEYFTGTLVDLISIAKNAVKGLFKKIVTPVSSRLVGDLKELGIEISEEYKHVVDNYAIRHTFNNHGGKGEYLRGQIPINNSDFELIPDIVNNYDNITAIVTKKGLPGILYEKTFEDGTTVYVEEIHNKHKELALVSMRKIKRPILLGANRTNEPTPIPSSGKSSADKGSDNIGDVQEDAKYSLRSNSQEVADIVAKAKADGTYMKAPNGEPTNLTEEQWANVRTKDFKDWFGDWELANLYNRAVEAWNNKNSKGKCVFGLSEKAREQFNELLGNDARQLIITDDAIRHIKNNHGENEELRGQKNVTPEDVVVIPYLINNFDSMGLNPEFDDKLGNKAIEIRKRINGVSIVATIERGKNKEFLASNYQFIKPDAIDASKETPGPNVRNDSDIANVRKEIETIKENAKKSSKIVDELHAHIIGCNSSCRY